MLSVSRRDREPGEDRRHRPRGTRPHAIRAQNDQLKAAENTSMDVLLQPPMLGTHQ